MWFMGNDLSVSTCVLNCAFIFNLWTCILFSQKELLQNVPYTFFMLEHSFDREENRPYS